MTIQDILCVALLLLLNFAASSCGEVIISEFFKECPPTRCGGHAKGPVIRYPLRSDSSPEKCGMENTGLSCSRNRTILRSSSGDALSLSLTGDILHASGASEFEVTEIDYEGQAIKITNGSLNSSCPLQAAIDISETLLTRRYSLCPLQAATPMSEAILTRRYSLCSENLRVLNCSTRLNVEHYGGAVAGPFSCLIGNFGYVYAARAFLSMHDLPSGACQWITNASLPSSQTNNSKDTGALLSAFSHVPEFTLFFNSTLGLDCPVCESYGGHCGFDWGAKHTTCIPVMNNHHVSIETKSFFEDCPPKTCSSEGPIVRFPLSLESSPGHCGLKNTGLYCSDNQTMIKFPSGTYEVTAIDYAAELITIKSSSRSSSGCLLRDFASTGIPDTSIFGARTVVIMNCSVNLTLEDYHGRVSGPFSCFTGVVGSVYAAEFSVGLEEIPQGSCSKISNAAVSLPILTEDLGRQQKLSLRWSNSIEGAWREGNELLYADCRSCEANGLQCGFKWSGNCYVCIAIDSDRRRSWPGCHVALITGISIGVFVALVLAGYLYWACIYGKHDNEKEIRLRVENFLATYKAAKPTRYSYSDIKRITKRFKQRIGQGGFGSVYKGELANGIPVAVKMLEHSVRDGEDFINEVATIGRIHHFNVVRLLGFCSEGSRRVLVYEFLSNESLEKFIFWKEGVNSEGPFSLDKLLSIAVGVAQGIEYLHQGCNLRILHFDIKPHNILLDHNFNPKLSDFGLAKLCSKDQSIVTMTTARGTMGYIAPEIYSRNFGTVSYKSDVYSFGMLLFEMVNGKRNVDPQTADQNEVYFPEWIYERLVQCQNLGTGMDTECNDDIEKKLLMVALWCIQWNPADRPSMTRVVQMLVGDLESITMPPKPFVSS